MPWASDGSDAPNMIASPSRGTTNDSPSEPEVVAPAVSPARPSLVGRRVGSGSTKRNAKASSLQARMQLPQFVHSRPVICTSIGLRSNWQTRTHSPHFTHLSSSRATRITRNRPSSE